MRYRAIQIDCQLKPFNETSKRYVDKLILIRQFYTLANQLILANDLTIQ